MVSRVVGNKNQFAIEFRQGSSQKLGYVKIWFNNIYLGADEEVYFSYVQGALQYILTDKDKLAGFPYESNSAKSILDKVIRDKTTSLSKYIMKGFGESFDDFIIICFYSKNRVNFVWQLVEKPHFDYHDYPLTAQIASFDINDFSGVVYKFNNELIDSHG